MISRESVTSLNTHLGRVVRPLAGATSDEVTVIGTSELLALREDGAWQTWGWHEIAGGSWQADTSSLIWRDVHNQRFEAKLGEPGRLPELFRDRVHASTVLTESHDVTGGTVEITGRRALDGSGQVQWYAVAGGRASLADPETAALVVARTEELAEEYGF